MKCMKQQSSDENPDIHKLIIGKGIFRTLRFAMSLTTNQIFHIMKPGQIICVKKTSSPYQDISWVNISRNDYSSGEISDLIFGQSVYELRIIEAQESISTKHHKGYYTFQEFLVVYDGSKAFIKQNAPYMNQWDHQKK